MLNSTRRGTRSPRSQDPAAKELTYSSYPPLFLSRAEALCIFDHTLNEGILIWSKQPQSGESKVSEAS